MTAITNVDFEVERQKITSTRAVEADLQPLTEGQVRLRIDRFALTANNVSYAITGDQLDYWGFFPADDTWGRIPAMGWADLVESKHADIPVGGRYYGWYPMSRFVTVDAKPSSAGLVDQGAHRARHAPIYRAYLVSDRDPLYNPKREDEQSLLRGLFATAFLAEDFFFDQDFFGAHTQVVLSASSKTAIGFAAQARTRGRGPVIGVTSARNQVFVEQLGYYDQVVAYDQIHSIPVDDSVLIDMSGNGDAVGRVHRHLGARLRYSMAVGASHWQAERAGAKDLPGAKPAFFFAPSQAKKRLEDWGPAGYTQRIAAALSRFVEGSAAWLEVDRSYGPEAVGAIYQRLLEGNISPKEGKIASLHAAPVS